MMKQLLTSIFAFSFLAIFGYSAKAQSCTPDESNTVVGVSPETLQSVCVGTAIDQTLSITLPSDTAVEIIPGNPTTLDLDSAVISNVSGLPNGVTYGCHNASCSISQTGQSLLYGCVRLEGTPTQATTNPNTVTMTVDFYVSGISAAREFYFILNAYDASAPECSAVGFDEYGTSQFNFSVFPNPAHEDMIQFSQEAHNLKIFNAKGDVVFAASSLVEFNSSTLEPGVYFVQADEGTTRLVVE